VEIRLEAGSTVRRTTSGPDGSYSFSDLEPRDYELVVTTSGFRPFRQALSVPAATDVHLDVALDPAFEETVAVTATRSERPTEDIPASISVVDEDQLKETPMTNISSALDGIPGTLVEAKNQGYDARLIIRGAGLKARYGIREIMVLLNGIPITDPDSLTRLDFVDTRLVERVEVVRGPNSTMWGINATGGAVNVITRSPAENPGTTASVDLASPSASGARVSHSGPLIGNSFFSLDVGHTQASNDWRPHNRFSSTQVTLQPWVPLGDDDVLENYLSYTQASLELPGSLVVNPTKGIDQWQPYLDTGDVAVTADPWRNSGRDSKIVYVASKLRTSIGDFRLEPVIYFNKWSHFHPVTGKINEADTGVGGVDVPLSLEHNLGTLTAGATFRFDHQASEAFTYADVAKNPTGRILYTLSDKEGTKMESYTRETWLGGVYGQESLRLGGRFIVDLGARVDKIRFSTVGTEWLTYDYTLGRWIPGAGAIDTTKSFTAFSPRFGVVADLGRRLHAYASIGTGVQTPTSDELTTNPELDLTRVRNYEVGLKGRGELFTFDLAVYSARVQDEVVRVVEGSGASAYVNAGSTAKDGAELSISASPWRAVDVGGQYSYSNYHFLDFSEPAGKLNLDRSGNRLPYVPEHQYSVFASWRHRSGLSIRAAARTWGTYFVDNANSETYPGYDWSTDLTLGYAFGDLLAQVMVENLFDSRYAIEVQKDLTGAKQYSPTSPRALRLRLSYRF
jgi:iron complex outermembrane recepter protein